MHPAGFFLDRVKGIVIGKIGVRIERADLGESKQRCSSLFDLRAGEDAPVVPRIILNAVGTTRSLESSLGWENGIPPVTASYGRM